MITENAMRYLKLMLFLMLSVHTLGSLAKETPEELFKRSGCVKCHHVTADRKKEGPSVFTISRTWKNKKNGRDEIYDHIVNSHYVDLGGYNDLHPVLKTNNKKRVDEVVDWILSK